MVTDCQGIGLDWGEVRSICRLAKRTGDHGALYAFLMSLEDKIRNEAQTKEDAVRAVHLFACAIRDGLGVEEIQEEEVQS